MSEEAKGKSGAEKKPFYKKVWFWAIVVVAVICVGAAGSASDKDPKKVEDGSSSSETSNKDEKAMLKVGDKVAIDDKEVVVTEVKRGYTPKYLEAGNGKEYVLVRVELQNKDDEKTSWSSSDWKMEDSNGAIEGTAIMANDEDDRLDSGELAPNGKKAGSLVFEVPKDDKNLKIHYKPNMFIDREAIIELQ